MVRITYVYIDTVFGFYVYFFLNAHPYCLAGCLNMIACTRAVLGVLYARVFVFALVQRNSACFTWKGALEILSLLSF